MDTDSVPESEALANLLAFFQRLSPLEQDQICYLACRLLTVSGAARVWPTIFTQKGIEPVALDVSMDHAACDCFIWTASLYWTPAVVKSGLPSEDYVLDVGELEYSYRAEQLGFRSYVVTTAVVYQDVGRSPGVFSYTWCFGPIAISLLEVAPICCYYRVPKLALFLAISMPATPTSLDCSRSLWDGPGRPQITWSDDTNRVCIFDPKPGSWRCSNKLNECVWAYVVALRRSCRIPCLPAARSRRNVYW